MPSRLAALPLSLLLLAAGSACSAPAPADSTQHKPQEVRPWKPFFTGTQFLLANDITIEGPEGLREHVAIFQDASEQVYTTKAVLEGSRQGLVQEVVLRPDVPHPHEIRAQLDSLEVRAYHKLTVIERPTDVPLVVRGSGDAYWATADGKKELRRDKIVLPLDIPR